MSTKSQKNTKNRVELDESWRDGSIAQRNLHMLNSESMADCTFVVGAVTKKKFQCHKYVLCHGSPVFYAMFNGDLREKGDVKVDDVEPQHFRKMLEFLYSGNTELENVKLALSVCYAANKYMINMLTLKCIDFIKKNMNADTVFKALEFSRLIDNADLEAKSLKYFHSNTSDVLNSASFPNVERATLVAILSQDHLCIKSEVELYSACVRWAEAQQRGDTDSLREVLGPDVLSLIKFLTMTVQEFATVVIPSKLLQLQEEQYILYRLVTGTGDMPQGFNTNTESRVLFDPREIINLKKIFVGPYSGAALNGCPFCFTVNVESYIFGLQVFGLGIGNASVQDSFDVQLLRNSTPMVPIINFEGEMSPGKTVEVNFNKPILLRPNVYYTLQVTYSNLQGLYQALNLADEVTYTTAAGVKMTVGYNSTTISQIFIAKKVK